MNKTLKEVQVRDVVIHSEEEIGKELSHAHKLLCRLRHAGATRRDLIAMRDVDIKIFSEFVANVRGIEIPRDGKLVPLLINLDYEPEILESLANLSHGVLTKDDDTIVDDRFGMWPLEESDGQIIFGSRKFVVEKPSGGLCVEKLGTHNMSFSPALLLGLTPAKIFLNLAMASWFSKDGRIDIPFDGLPFGKAWKDNTIFFLGTVWFVSAKKVFLAPALTSSKNGDIKFEIKPIPEGKWPSNCYVALLVPRW